MKIAYDAAKNEKNVRQRGLSFERAVDFDFETAVFIPDTRRDYGEQRIVAIGYLDNRLHVFCFVEFDDAIRVISFRKANLRESRRYGKPIEIAD